MKPTKGVIMGVFEAIVNSVAASVMIRDDADAIRHLLEIIEKHDIELTDLEKSVVTMIKYR